MPIPASWKSYSGTLYLKRHAIVLAAILMAAFCAPGANATTTTYSYTGNDFTNVGGLPYTSSDRVTGYFSIATLGDSLPFAPITPIFFSFSDGVNKLDSSNAIIGTFEVATDPMGRINQWLISIGASSDPSATVIGTANYLGQIADNGSNDLVSESGTQYADNENSAGIWNTVPEPSSVGLVSIALVAFAFAARRRTARALPPASRTIR